MLIKNVEIQNFRNLANRVFEFSEKLNIIYGDNASGKTNLIESLYICSMGKSVRASDKELINFNKELANIQLNGINRYGNTRIAVKLHRNMRKNVLVDGIAINKISDLLSNLICVYFSPDELKLIKDAPESRRRFLDVCLSQLYKIYYDSLVKYNKILDQRNILLKKASKQALCETLPIWNEQLATTGLLLKNYREKFLKELLPFAEKTHLQLSGKREILGFEYATTLSGVNTTNDYLLMLESSLDKDIRLGFTSVGTHRDDIKITLSGVDVRNFGSQGQQRSVALSLIIAECELIKTKIGEYPILLLDDVLSELDLNRQRNLLAVCQNFQTFITTAVLEKGLCGDAKYIEIKQE